MTDIRYRCDACGDFWKRERESCPYCNSKEFHSFDLDKEDPKKVFKKIIKNILEKKREEKCQKK
jgi:hypothetical protein